MRRGISWLALVAAMFGAGAPSAAAEPAAVEFGSGFFTPNDVTVDLQLDSNEVEFNRNDLGPDYHSVTSVNGLFGLGPGGFEEFDVQASAGTFRYYCVNHGYDDGSGMAGVFAVRPIASDVTSDRFEVTWADAASTTGFEYSVRYRVEDKEKWKSWIAGASTQSRPFGKKDVPTNVKPAKTYEIQVRSEGGGGKSAWSPKLVVSPGA